MDPCRRAIRAEDLFDLVLPTDPRMAPDGERILFVLQRTDWEKNRYHNNLWMVSAAGGDARPFTHGDHRDTAPRWSPDGRQIAFLSDRDETQQIWILPADGGEARKLTSLPEGALSPPVWAPDGAFLLFSYRPTPPDATKKAREEREKAHRSTPPRVVRRLHYREEGVGYFGDERWHLYVARVSDGETRALTDGDTDEHEPIVSPDGRRIAFVSNRSPDPDLEPNAQEIWVMPFAWETGGSGLDRLNAPHGPKSSLAWSPDGREIAYVGHDQVEDRWGVTNASLWRVGTEPDGPPARDVTADLDRPLGSAVLSDTRAFGGGEAGPIWTASGEILFLVSDRGSTHLYAVDGEGRRRVLVEGRREVAAVTADREGRRLALLIGRATEPGDIYSLDLPPPAPPSDPSLAAGILPPPSRSGRRYRDPHGGREENAPPSPPGRGAGGVGRLTHLNQPLLDQLQIAEPEEIVVSSSDGQEIHGWLLRPVETREGERPPLILQIHGGPHTMYGNAFNHEFQLLAARGYCVLYTNPRGSKGYGQAFTTALKGRWGEADFPDLMAMVDAVVARGEVDPDRLGVTGGSYGGFMTNWIVSHTDRFRAAVTQRSVTNLHSMAGTCDFPMDDHRYFDANAWDDPAGYLRLSPLTYAAKVRTPLLILHSEGDLRCPIEQAEQWFAALKRLGCEVEFVRFPREANHGLSRGGPPDLRLERLERIIGWMDRHLGVER